MGAAVPRSLGTAHEASRVTGTVRHAATPRASPGRRVEWFLLRPPRHSLGLVVAENEDGPAIGVELYYTLHERQRLETNPSGTPRATP